MTHDEAGDARRARQIAANACEGSRGEGWGSGRGGLCGDWPAALRSLGVVSFGLGRRRTGMTARSLLRRVNALSEPRAELAVALLGLWWPDFTRGRVLELSPGAQLVARLGITCKTSGVSHRSERDLFGVRAQRVCKSNHTQSFCKRPKAGPPPTGSRHKLEAPTCECRG